MRRLPLFAAIAACIAMPAAAALTTGAKAPDFTTRGAIAGKAFTLHLAEQLKKGPVVLYFFPAAFTPGCNAEAKAFADKVAAFKAEGATVIGMSADPVEKLQKFSTAHCAGKFAVASATPEIIREYDVALKAGDRTITDRTSYVIAPGGQVVYAHTDMSPAEHVRNTLAAVKEWKKQPK